MDKPKNIRNEKGEGSKAASSVDCSTVDDALVCDDYKYDSTEDNSSRDGSTKESSKGSSTTESSKDGSTKESSKDSSSKTSSTKESSKASSTKESSKDSSTKESSKDSSTKESSKESSKTGSTKESSKASSTKESTKESSAKDDVRGDNSQDESIEEDSIGDNIEEIAEEVADEVEEEEGEAEAEADWPAEPQDINSPDSPGDESPIHGPPAMELIVHEAASEGIVAPEDVIVFEPEVSVAVEVVHVVSVPAPLEEQQRALMVVQENASATPSVSVREHLRASNFAQQSLSANPSNPVREPQPESNVALPSSANPSVPVREQQQASNVAQRPSSANPSVPVREQQQASNVAQQPSSANPSVPVREQQQASNVAQQPSSANPAVPLRQQLQASNVAQQPSLANPSVPAREQQQESNVAQQPSSANPSVPEGEQQQVLSVAEKHSAAGLSDQQTTNPQPGTLETQPLNGSDCGGEVRETAKESRAPSVRSEATESVPAHLDGAFTVGEVIYPAVNCDGETCQTVYRRILEAISSFTSAQVPTEPPWRPAGAIRDASEDLFCIACHGSEPARNFLSIQVNEPTLLRQPTSEPGPVKLVQVNVMRLPLLPMAPTATHYGTPSRGQTSPPGRGDEDSLRQPTPEPGPVQLVDFRVMRLPVLPTAPEPTYDGTPSREQTSPPGREDEDLAASAADHILAASVICGAIAIALLAVARYLNWR